ncbi:hypothetical protein CAPTEDRAFT_221817 [Capitella teleta]|uniref:BTB domain-containing protein n=1 Tax=Capitella teleta TaxID=283909 RepID=R7VKU6_CAPTE|nr:hypothetical protein CAPTEDRAFT_221817 [Capitella teleta]|eukprot:ELU17080.1 hypothetical protein CAPTEDRAFT_221817 [Capitella teleta]
MDFSKFRDTGELSDINVVVDGKEFLLHKFPLFIKSDFFRALARSPKGESIKLDDFPGGPEVFAEVANYFYNVKLTLNKTNVCQLRCAAEFLQMTSPGNLSSLADRVLQDTLTSAKLGHKFDIITDLIAHCRSLGAIAEQAGVVEKCINAIVDCWLISPKFSRRYTLDGKFSNDDESIKLLSEFPLDWCKITCVTAREKSIRPTVLANLIQSYISHAVDSMFGDKSEKTSESVTPEDEAEKEEVKGNDDQPKSNEDIKQETAKETDKTTESKTQIEDAQMPDNPDLDLGKVMDTLLFEVPLDSPVMVESFCHSWVIEMLKVAQDIGCDSKKVLLILASRMMYRYSKDDLAGLPADILVQIIEEGCKDNRANPDDVCRVLYGYLMDQAAKDKLSLQTFQKLVKAIPKNSRVSDDMLFTVLETLLKSKNISVDDKQKQELLETVDFSRLSECTLQCAYDSGLVPGAYVTKAALSLCTKLRSDLDAAKVIIRDQELRLERYGITLGAGTSWLKSVEAGSAGRQKAKSTDFPDLC